MRNASGRERSARRRVDGIDLCARAVLGLASLAVVGLSAASCATSPNDGLGGGGGAGVVSSSSADVASSASTTVASTASSTAASTASSTASASSSVSGSSVSGSTGTGTMCGDGVIEPPEQCEGTDFGGKTCMTFGLSGGSLVCNPFCGIVVSGCTPAEVCGDGIDNDEDGATDCDDTDCATATTCTDACGAATLLTVPSTFNSFDLTGRPDLLTSSCTASGREMVFQFTVTTAGDYVFAAEFGSFDASVSIRTDCSDVASELACKNVFAAGSNEGVAFTGVAGQTYFAIVEAADNGVGSFEVDLEPAFPESFCSNFDDDDFNGFTDCDDPGCQGTFDCVSGIGLTGTSCFSNGDCKAATNGDPICFPDFMGWPNGYCSEFCDLATNDCPGTGQCKQIGISTDGICLAGCTVNADCAPGYGCLDEGLGGLVCDIPPEANCNDYSDNDSDGDVDCADSTNCQSTTTCTPGAGIPGDPCNLHNQCAANANDPFCIDDFHFGYSGGYCSEFCNLGVDDCPAGSECLNLFFIGDGNRGLCMKTCATDVDCRAGYFCNTFDHVCEF